MSELDVREKVKLLPRQPGVYQFLDAEGNIVYIGKAIDLRSRVGSYFGSSTGMSGKTLRLVRTIVDLRTILVATEFDALLLENSLIKQHQPKYNVALKDDKSYPWIRIRNERFPRVEGMRNPEHDGSEYFGPYASGKVMHTVLHLIRKLYRLRTCNLDLSKKNVEAGKFKVCLEYHIGNCKGPCVGNYVEEDHTKAINEIRQIVRGRARGVLKMLDNAMLEYADKLEFEQAEQLRERIDHLERFQRRNTVVSTDVGDVDVFTIVSDEGGGYVNYLRVIDGAVVHGISVEMKRKLEESEKELLQLAIVELRSRFSSTAPEIIVPIDIGLEIPHTAVSVPTRGDRKKLLELSVRNAQYFMMDKQKQEKLVDPEAHTTRLMETAQKDLRLPVQPRHIECFDNSNTQGTDPVSACVVFRDGKPSKKDYRHFNVKTVEGPDDFATMKEAVHRRYRRLLDESADLPQLILIDGGKGQLSAAMESLDALGLRGKIAVIGIAKRLEELYYPDDPVPLHIDKRSSTLKLLQHLRNEAHRFGITHHRGRRSKRIIRTGLENIPGIGKATAEKLLKRFGSVKGIQEAIMEDLVAEVGAKKAVVVKEAVTQVD
ncbi:MAG: excinuclease ABC subunit C [Flavobacteriales bacterium]|nr:excinuclease ABC subunit C [Flavobacteriales bacterium]